MFAVSGSIGLYPKYFGLFNVCYCFVCFGFEIATERQALERYMKFATKTSYCLTSFSLVRECSPFGILGILCGKLSYNIGLVLWRGMYFAHTRHRNQAFFRCRKCYEPKEYPFKNRNSWISLIVLFPKCNIIKSFVI